MVKKITSISLALLTLSLTGCGNNIDTVSKQGSAVSLSDISETTPTDVQITETETSVLNRGRLIIDNDQILMRVDLSHPDDTDWDAVYLLLVMKDGSLITTDYTFPSDYNYAKQIALGDAQAWEKTSDPKLIGTLSEEALHIISEEVYAVDINSEKYESDDEGETPDVVETNHYIFSCYPPDEPPYCICAYGEQKGRSILTKDEHAVNAMQTLQNDIIYQQWTAEHANS